MTIEQRLAELQSMTAELSQLISKLGMLNELTAGVLAEAKTIMVDVSNAAKWTAEDISNKQE